jgi:PIN domain nuclease of toxin-antitoxin system
MIFLDTMAFLYFMEDSLRMPRELHDAIVSSPTVYVSVASVWEIGIKACRAKLTIDGNAIGSSDALRRMVRAAHEQNLIVLPVTAEDAIEAPFLVADHKDPFDRMIVAQAIERGATLFSSDSTLDSLSPALRRRW